MDSQFFQTLYGIPKARADVWALILSDVCKTYGIDTHQRKACFVAHVGHESGRLKYVKEIWGPTRQQLRYEPVTSLSKTLGNVRAGDGKLYMGRGVIQNTGLGNYKRLTARLRKRFPNCPDFVASPAELERPFWAAMAAGDYWDMRGLNKFADSYDFAELTRRINGGYNGLEDRLALYNRASLILMFEGEQ